MKMDSGLLAQAMAAATNDAGFAAQIAKRNNDPNLWLGAYSCSVHTWNGGPSPYYFRVLFDFYYPDDLSQPHPYVFLDLELYDGHFQPLAKPATAHQFSEAYYADGTRVGNG